MAKVWHPKPGQPVRLWRKQDGTVLYRSVCCDCGLTHQEYLKPTKRYITTRAWRDEPYTAGVRKQRKAQKK